jgi:basic membrane protein A and related proteins
MRSMRPVRALAFLAVLMTLAASCAGGAEDPCAPGDKAAEGGASVGIAFDVGGLGDKSFNDSAHRGLLRAIDRGLVSDANCLEANATGSNRDDNVLNLADQEVQAVGAIGFSFSPGIVEIAPSYPDTKFGVIDGYATCGEPCGLSEVDTDNVSDLTFKEHEGSFLVGVAAGLASEAKIVGFLGGQEGTGLIEKFQAGFEQGVQEVCPECEILVRYIGDSVQAFNDPTRGEALSGTMYDDGADVVYHAAGASGLGLFKAAVDAGPDALAIGVDSDQYLTASEEEKPHILTSMIKRVDTAIFNFIESVDTGTFQPGPQVFGLAEEGVDYSQSNEELMTDDMIATIDDYKQQIIDGDIVVLEEPRA